MRRGAKPAKAKVEAKLPVARKSLKNERSRVRQLQKRLGEALKREAEALDQQTASAEVLRVIASSPTDLQPVFDAVAKNAARLCHAEDASILQADGGVFRVVAYRGASRLKDFEGTPVSRGSVAGRAILDGQVVHVHNITEESEAEFSVSKALVQHFGHSTMLATPLLRKGTSIGAIFVRRTQVQPFSDKQIALLRTFADQAVIAIENVRLFKELEARNRDLTESLARQTATGEILEVISSSPTDVQPVFDTIVESAARLCDAVFSTLQSFDGELIHLVAAHNWTPTAVEVARRIWPAHPSRALVTGRAILERSVVHVPDVELDPEFGGQEVSRAIGFRSALCVPMLREGVPLGVLSVSRAEPGPFSDNQIALLKTFADQAVIAIENVRLFNETNEALEQQTATSEILGVISQSPTDVQPVFDTIAARAKRLCDALECAVFRFDGELIHLVAQADTDAAWANALRSAFPRQPGRGSITARAIQTRSLVHIPDVQADPEFDLTEAAQVSSIRSVLSVPMMREGEVIGAITVDRRDPKPFLDKQIALMETFADQAVIAIENVRLFKELEERNRELTDSLDRQTSTADVLRVISRSPTDIQQVFDTIVRSASRLCAGHWAAAMRFDGELIHLAAQHNIGPAAAEFEDLFPCPPSQGLPLGRAILKRELVHIPDAAEDPDIAPGVVRRARSFLVVPMLREGAPIGAIAVSRPTPGRFPPSHIELLSSFADQAVIAIENVRLFKELEARNRDLTATGEILQVISRSQIDVQPVFDTIVRSAVRLCDGLFSALLRFDGELIHHVANYNFTPEALEEMHRIFPMRPNRALGGARAILERAVVHMPDNELDPEFQHQALSRAIGWRSGLFVPMLREGAPIGAIVVGRAEPGPFSDSQIELLKTFADQAVIAIENVRLFTELQQKNEALTHAHAQVTEALDQQTATAEILRVISSSPTDLEPVAQAIADSAGRLCDCTYSAVFRFDGELIHWLAARGTSGVQEEALRGVWPRPPDRETLVGRAILAQETLHIHDAASDPTHAASLPIARSALAIRSWLGVPILREGEPIGVIALVRLEVRPFSEQEIALVQTFANQAVIAIENVRLFTELQARNRDLTQALEQQTATSQILRVISLSPTDVQPVFEAIVESAVRLCDGARAVAYRFDGELQQLVAYSNFPPDSLDLLRRLYPRRPDPDSASGQAILDHTVIHVPDTYVDPRFARTRQISESIGMESRSVLAVPMLHQGEAVGVIVVNRGEQPRPFSSAEIALLRTFADQAVIAIENVRLFKELEARNRELTRALEQQTATAEILRVISSSPTEIQPVLDTVAEKAARLCGADDAVIQLVEGDVLRLASHHGSIVADIMLMPISSGLVVGKAVMERRTIHIHDMADEHARGNYPECVEHRRRVGYRTLLIAPLLREGTPVGAIVMRRLEVRDFTEEQISLLQTFADQAVIAIENVRLFTELQEKNRQVTEALEQQTATAEILRVISRSQTDVQPVFDTIVRSAVRLCSGLFGALYQFDGELLYHVAHHNYTPEALEASHRAPPARPTRAVGSGRAILERAVVHIPDIELDPEYQPHELSRAIGFRSLLCVPMLREGAPIGVILVARAAAGPFSDNEIELLKTFADQAVIAVENARLFKELQARTGELTQSVEQLTALGEVSRAVSSTLDVETVLDTIVSRASQLAGAAGCSIYEYDEGTERFELRAMHNYDAEFVEALRAVPLRKGEGLMGRAAEMREPIQIPDITQPGAYQSSVRDTLIRFGYHALLSVPLLREDQIIGSLSFNRKAPGEFPPEVVDVLKTFATQSALAIQNARLFREIADKSAQLEAASRHKSEFLANMSHELRTPLNAIIGFSEVLSEGMFGEINEKQTEYLQDILESGRHLLSLINDILDLSKIEAGRMELERSEFHLPGAIDNALILVRERANRRGIRLGSTIDERLGMIGGDERKVKQVLLNLLSNALKFTPEGGRIDVGAHLRDGVAEVSVTDTGVGIAPEDQEAVFEEFRQVGAVDKKVEGTGLGLALSRKFVELHGGRIWVESEVGRGSTFTFTLPVRS